MTHSHRLARSTSALAAALLLVLPSAGCGGDTGGEAPGEAGAAREAAATESSEPTGEHYLTFTMEGGPDFDGRTFTPAVDEDYPFSFWQYVPRQEGTHLHYEGATDDGWKVELNGLLPLDSPATYEFRQGDDGVDDFEISFEPEEGDDFAYYARDGSIDVSYDEASEVIDATFSGTFVRTEMYSDLLTGDPSELPTVRITDGRLRLPFEAKRDRGSHWPGYGADEAGGG